MENTRALFDVLRQREELARELKKHKERAGIPLRDREQEIRVLDGAGNLTSRERNILNLIFEFTISVQEGEPGVETVSGRSCGSSPMVVRGEPESLHYIAGLLISGPGKEIHCNGKISEPLKSGLIDGGGHIINGNSEPAPLRVCLGFDDGGCSVSLGTDGTMKVRADALLSGSIAGKAMIEGA